MPNEPPLDKIVSDTTAIIAFPDLQYDINLSFLSMCNVLCSEKKLIYF